mmetsp:Transcript_38885/g.44793  ORF Transcript_38885/g.44793 Transcript_38885/m.44793 type:complete len:84 (+) Transcript_38885:1092-1343(+)
MVESSTRNCVIKKKERDNNKNNNNKIANQILYNDIIFQWGLYNTYIIRSDDTVRYQVPFFQHIQINNDKVTTTTTIITTIMTD